MEDKRTYYSAYTAQESAAEKYKPRKLNYDKELLWENRKKYLGHKRAVGYLYTADIVLGLFGALYVKGELSGIAYNPSAALSLLIILGLVAASVISVTCLENPKVLKLAAAGFAAAGLILVVLSQSVLYLIFFILYTAQMIISLILSKNLLYLKTQFGYPYFNEAIVENQMRTNRDGTI